VVSRVSEELFAPVAKGMSSRFYLKYKTTKHERDYWGRTGEELPWMTGRVTFYEVLGFCNEKAFIANIGAWNQDHWSEWDVLQLPT
jgi:hypothetical protein